MSNNKIIPPKEGQGARGRVLLSDLIKTVNNYQVGLIEQVVKKTSPKKEHPQRVDQENQLDIFKSERPALLQYIKDHEIAVPKGYVSKADLISSINKHRKLSVRKRSPEKIKDRKISPIKKNESPKKVVEYGKLLCDFTMTGRRMSNEDTHVVGSVGGAHPFKLYGVLDGHSGKLISKTLADKLLPYFKELFEDQLLTEKGIKDAIIDLDESFRSISLEVGSCAIIALIQGEDIYFVNLGDSRGLLFNDTGKIILETVDHKPGNPSEKDRIEKAGGFVKVWGVPRVNGQLAVSRAFGDFYLKGKKGTKYLVSNEPDVYHYRVKDGERLTIFLACDGLYDELSTQEVVDRLAKSKTVGTCETIAKEAYRRGSEDNISTMLLEV